ncbi:succinate dehydrogenase cytochrome b subunit [Bernardetia sp.]|uniref:succinate dehydrogenase cytochrome b subunit n=1 Tax=Bernardetia sp. TaxID=1937974 RepID=UPI0025C3958F|nr:succinate dehydrogenase cytochrome b subunit [Bernardetia sp.]
MNWIIRTLTSSIGRKVLMSLTGLFLVTFLIVHMSGNFQLLIPDIASASEKFNVYAVFMTTFPLIKITSYLLYGSIVLHALVALFLTLQNKKARPTGYAVSGDSEKSWASRNMGILGSILLFFIIMHMGQFWFQYHFGGNQPVMEIDGVAYKNLYALVATTLSVWWFAALYLVSMLAVGMHLWHGFQSGFQTLGLNHKKYTPLISAASKALAILFIVGFSSMPLAMLAQFGVANSIDEAADNVRNKFDKKQIEWKTSDWSSLEPNTPWENVKESIAE